jgi:DedD protein|tara:strand:- start:2662 stop:3189 length:528 start_codon:yes stop_codon:yes gene_type:complete
LREETRYRVTGSLFLLALAVICLPMLFDGAGLPAEELPPLDFDEPLPEPEIAPVPAPESDFVERVETLREQVDEQGFLTDSGTRFGEPVLTDANADTDVWAVQVASFADTDNAENFRGRLRGDGYEAFLSTVRTDDQVLSRVAVGPLLDRQEAESLQRELSARYDTQARLMAFSN